LKWSEEPTNILAGEISFYFSTQILKKISDTGTVYKIAYIDVDGKPEVQF